LIHGTEIVDRDPKPSDRDPKPSSLA
jgi:hypothetical protein